MRYIKISLGGTLSKITNKQSLEYNEKADRVETILDVLKQLDQEYGQRILPEIQKSFNLLLQRDDEPPQVIPLDKIDTTRLGKKNIIKFFYRFTGG